MEQTWLPNSAYRTSVEATLFRCGQREEGSTLTIRVAEGVTSSACTSMSSLSVCSDKQFGDAFRCYLAL
ncbi:hypothetical protein OK016_28330 [Vibrio chagasii]|nr:hypothetical protein [Vibrio chagasii]